jgi:hypothetical protein
LEQSIAHITNEKQPASLETLIQGSSAVTEDWKKVVDGVMQMANIYVEEMEKERNRGLT